MRSKSLSTLVMVAISAASVSASALVEPMALQPVFIRPASAETILQNVVDQLDNALDSRASLSTATTESLLDQIDSVWTSDSSLSATDVQTLTAVENELQNSLDSDNEISEMGSMQLQMLMDARSKLLQTASDIEKTKSDTGNSIVQNIKQ